MDEGGAAMWKQVTAMHYNALQKQVLPVTSFPPFIMFIIVAPS